LKEKGVREKRFIKQISREGGEGGGNRGFSKRKEKMEREGTQPSPGAGKRGREQTLAI